MWCSHNELDLVPQIASADGNDWVVVLCKACDSYIGSKVRLGDLVDQALRRAKDTRQAIDEALGKDEPEDLDPEWE